MEHYKDVIEKLLADAKEEAVANQDFDLAASIRELWDRVNRERGPIVEDISRGGVDWIPLDEWCHVTNVDYRKTKPEPLSDDEIERLQVVRSVLTPTSR